MAQARSGHETVNASGKGSMGGSGSQIQGGQLVSVEFSYFTFAGSIARHLVRHDTIEHDYSRWGETVTLLPSTAAPQKLGILGLFVVSEERLA